MGRVLSKPQYQRRLQGEASLWQESFIKVGGWAIRSQMNTLAVLFAILWCYLPSSNTLYRCTKASLLHFSPWWKRPWTICMIGLWCTDCCLGGKLSCITLSERMWGGSQAWRRQNMFSLSQCSLTQTSSSQLNFTPVITLGLIIPKWYTWNEAITFLMFGDTNLIWPRMSLGTLTYHHQSQLLALSGERIFSSQL